MPKIEHRRKKMKPQQAKSTADKLLEQANRIKERYELSKEEQAEIRKACRSLFSTRNGKIVAKAMMRVSGIYRVPKNNTNPIAMGEERGAEMMYLYFVKNNLSPEVLSEIERS